MGHFDMQFVGCYPGILPTCDSDAHGGQKNGLPGQAGEYWCAAPRRVTALRVFGVLARVDKGRLAVTVHL